MLQVMDKVVAVCGGQVGFFYLVAKSYVLLENSTRANWNTAQYR